MISILSLFPLPALLCAAVIDNKTQKIPNFITLPFILVGVALTFLFNNSFLVNCIVAIILLLFLASYNMMGMGDVKLLMVIASVRGVYITGATLGVAVIFLLVFRLCVSYSETRQALVNGLKMLAYKSLWKPADSKKIAFAVYIMLGYITTEGVATIWSLV